MVVEIKHECGSIKKVKVGYSWGTLLFGWLCPLVKGDLKLAMMMLITYMLAKMLGGVPGCIVVNIIYSFIYNRLHIQSLLEKGYSASNLVEDVIVFNYANGTERRQNERKL